MSTVGGYELHVYCDAPDCDERGQFAAVNYGDCVAQARAQGWKISSKEAPPDSVAGGKAALCKTHRHGPAQGKPE